MEPEDVNIEDERFGFLEVLRSSTGECDISAAIARLRRSLGCSELQVYAFVNITTLVISSRGETVQLPIDGTGSSILRDVLTTGTHVELGARDFIDGLCRDFLLEPKGVVAAEVWPLPEVVRSSSLLGTVDPFGVMVALWQGSPSRDDLRQVVSRAATHILAILLDRERLREALHELTNLSSVPSKETMVRLMSAGRYFECATIVRGCLEAGCRSRDLNVISRSMESLLHMVSAPEWGVELGRQSFLMRSPGKTFAIRIFSQMSARLEVLASCLAAEGAETKELPKQIGVGLLLSMAELCSASGKTVQEIAKRAAASGARVEGVRLRSELLEDAVVDACKRLDESVGKLRGEVNGICDRRRQDVICDLIVTRAMELLS